MTYLLSVLRFFWSLRKQIGFCYAAMPRAWQDVLIERVRRLRSWSFEHDDNHKVIDSVQSGTSGTPMVLQAVEFALPGTVYPFSLICNVDNIATMSERERLVKAAALLLAEVERIDRANGK